MSKESENKKEQKVENNEMKEYKVVIMPRVKRANEKYAQDGRILLKINTKVPSYSEDGDESESDLIGVSIDLAVGTIASNSILMASQLAPNVIGAMANIALAGCNAIITRKLVKEGEEYNSIVFERDAYVTTSFVLPDEEQKKIAAKETMLKEILTMGMQQQAAKDAAKEEAKNSIW